MDTFTQKRKMTDEMRKHFEKQLAKAEPYTEEEMDNWMFDGEYDHNRLDATLAKKFLEEDDALKAEEEARRGADG